MKIHMKRAFALIFCMAVLFPALASASVQAENGASERILSEEEMRKMLEEDRELNGTEKVVVTDTVENIYFPMAKRARASGLVYSGKADYHGYKVGIFTVDGETAFCMQHNKFNPESGENFTEDIYENEDIRRVLYYGMEGAKPWSGFENEVHARVLTSLALSYYYYGLPTMEEGDYIFQEGKLRAFLNYCESKSIPNTGLKLSRTNTEAYLTEDKKKQRTEEMKLTADKENSITFTVQNGVTVHNVTKGSTHTGKVTIHGGETFYLSAPLTLTDSWKSGKLQGSMKKFQTVMTIPEGNYQRLGRGRWWTDKTDMVEFAVEWLKQGKIIVEKTDSDTGLSAPQGNASGFRGTVYDVFQKSSYQEGDNERSSSFVACITLEADGTAESAFLPLDTYYVIERKAPSGYNVDTVKHEVTLPSKEDDPLAVHVQSKENVIRGGVRIEKWDKETGKNEPQGSAGLQNAMFQIISKNDKPVVVKGKSYTKNEVITTLVTNEKGEAETDRYFLPYGNYQIKETAPPKGYTGSGDIIRDFRITENGQIQNMNTSDTAIKNNVIRGGVYVEKWDREHNRHEAQGAASLKGARFQIVSRNEYPVIVAGKAYVQGEVVAMLVTDEKGEAKTDSHYLPYGNYRIEEIKPPEGYVNGGEISRDFTVTEDGELIKLNTGGTAIKNDIIRGDVEIVKIAENEEEEQDTLTGLAGVEFTFTSKTSGKEVKKIVTDKNGFATTKSDEYPKGSLPFDTYLVTETKVPEGFKPVEPFEVTIKEHGVTLKGIYKEDKLIVSPVAIVKADRSTGKTIPVKGVKFRLLDENKKPVTMTTHYPNLTINEIFQTDENGQFTFPEKLRAGTYYLREVKAPEGYLLNGEDLKFEVTEGAQWEHPLVVRCFDENAKGRIEIVKEQKDTKEKLRGAVFEVTAAEDIITPDGTLRVKKGEVVETVTTDENGKASAEGLFLGKYRIREMRQPAGFVLSDKTYEVELKYKDQMTAVVVETLNISNYPTTFRIRKTDKNTGEDMEGVVFQIWNKDVGETDAQMAVVPEFTTDAKGEICVQYLNPGTYCVQETKTPEGYILDGNIYEFTVSDDGRIEGENEYILSLQNDFTKVKILKTDKDTKQQISGAKILLEKENGELEKTFEVGEDGYVLERLPVGKYLLKEVEAPDGYQILEETVPFTVEEKAEEQLVKIENQKIPKPKETVKTGDNSSGEFYLAAMIVSVVLAAVFLKRKKKPEHMRHYQ